MFKFLHRGALDGGPSADVVPTYFTPPNAPFVGKQVGGMNSSSANENAPSQRAPGVGGARGFFKIIS